VIPAAGGAKGIDEARAGEPDSRMSASDLPLSRRHFLKSTGVAAATASLPAWFLEQQRAAAAPARPLSANDRPGIALIGAGGQGRYVTKLAQRFGDVVAVCDVDQRHVAEAAKQFGVPASGQYRDFREVLRRDDVHCIINGTPDHWHTLINIAAAKAGKDIYSEKPLTLTIDEGKHLLQAVRENKVVFQTGSQQRSDARFRLACELVRNGRLGKLQYIWVGLPTGPRGGPFTATAPPAELDWDYWLGQAPKVSYVPQRCHGSFRWWWNYSGGQMTDWGAHHFDIAQWGNGTERTGPVFVDGHSLKEMIPGGYETASDYVVYYKYANGVQMIATNQAPNGVRFEGTDGWIFVDRGRIEASRKELLEEPLSRHAERLYHSDDHMGNFFECLRTRKDPICDAEIGHRSISVAHLGVISMRLGRPLRWDPGYERFVGDDHANQWLRRHMRAPYDYSFVA
jgi:predicted dehydrogenase